MSAKVALWLELEGISKGYEAANVGEVNLKEHVVLLAEDERFAG